MGVTYYLGAGASAKALPCVANLAPKIREVFQFLQGNRPALHYPFKTQCSSDFGVETLDQEEIASMWGQLQEIEDEFLNKLYFSLSIDTLAKILHLQERNHEYNQLKGILIGSFVLWEHLNGFDNRYENFWATIAKVDSYKKKGEYVFQGFSNEISLISWNYDRQVEGSLLNLFRGFKMNHPFLKNGLEYGAVTKATGLPFVKLNGVADLHDSRKYFSAETEKNREDLNNGDLALLIAGIILFPQKFVECNNLRFCWEGMDMRSEPLINSMVSKVSESTTLVVVGYSFPSINHAIDIKIIESMHNLRNIYFQGIDRADSERIMESFKAICKPNEFVKFHPITSNGFFIPPDATIPIDPKAVAVW